MPIFEGFKSFLNIIDKSKIKKSSLILIIISFGLYLLIFLLVNTMPNPTYNPFFFIIEIINRFNMYLSWAINPNNYQFYETGIMTINHLGGFISYCLTFLILTFSLILNLRGLNYQRILFLLISYSYIMLFLFKETATIFSPNPASLLLLMILSTTLNSKFDFKYLKNDN